MSKRLNNILNGVEMLSLLIGVTCFALSVVVLPELSNKAILNTAIFIVGMLSNVIMISIEMVLFLISYKKCKILYTLYLVSDLALIIMINNVIPFAGILVLCAFCMLKGTYRILNLNKIYEPKKLETYLKIYNIKLKTNKKKKAITKKKTNTNKVEITKSSKKGQEVRTKKAIA